MNLMANKNILFISYDGMTDPLGQSQVIPYLAGLTKSGYTFTILSCDKPDKYALHGEYVKQLMSHYPIKWVSIPYHKNPPVLSSWYDYQMLRKTAARLHRENHFDLVHTRVGTPALVGYWLKRKYGIKHLNDIRGFWADERVEGGIWNIKNPVYKSIYRFFKKKEDEIIANADYNTCLTYAARNEINSWHHIAKRPIPIEVIPCSADMLLFDPANIDTGLKRNFKSELNIKDDDIVITYLGSIGGWYLTAEMMRFCKLLSEKMPAAKFLFITPHPLEIILSAAKQDGLSVDKIIVCQGKRHEVPALLSLSSYSIFFIKPCYSKIASSPTKHGEIMAMGIPVITNGGVGDVKEIVEKSNGGYVVDDFTTESFNRVINKILAGNPFQPAAIRDAAIETYALENAVNSYRSVYSKIFEDAKD